MYLFLCSTWIRMEKNVKKGLRKSYVLRGTLSLKKMQCTIQRMWKQDKKWEKGLKSISTVPPGPMEHSPLPMIINPDLGSAVYGSSVPSASRWFLSVSLLLPFHFLFYLRGTCWRKQNTSYTSAREKGRGAARRPSHRQLKGCWSLVSYRRQSQATPCELKEK